MGKDVGGGNRFLFENIVPTFLWMDEGTTKISNLNAG